MPDTQEIQEAIKKLVNKIIAGRFHFKDHGMMDYHIMAVKALALLEAEPEPTELTVEIREESKGSGWEGKKQMLELCDTIDRLTEQLAYKDVAITKLKAKKGQQANELTRLAELRKKHERKLATVKGQLKERQAIIDRLKAENADLKKALKGNSERIIKLVNLEKENEKLKSDLDEYCQECRE